MDKRRQRWSRHRFPPALSAKGERDQLRETSLLLLVLEGSASYLTLGDLLSLADDNHFCQRIDRLRDILECLCIEQDTG